MKVVKNSLKIKIQSFLKYKFWGEFLVCHGQCKKKKKKLLLQLPGFIIGHTVKLPDIC